MRYPAFQLLAACLAISAFAGAAAAQATEKKADPLAAEAARRRGVRALTAQDYDEALNAFEQALGFSPDNPDLLLQLGITHARMGDTEAAVEAYESLLAIEPSHAQALNNLANVYYRSNDFERAADFYRRALEADPDYMLALLHYGRTQHQLNQTEEAERVFVRCTTLPAVSPREQMMQLDCRYYLGSLRFRAGDYASTASLMEQVLELQPRHTEARYLLGMSYMRLGRTDEGRRQLEIHREMLTARRDQATIEKKQDP